MPAPGAGSRKAQTLGAHSEGRNSRSLQRCSSFFCSVVDGESELSVWRHASALLLLPPLRRYDHLSLRVHSFRAGEWVLQWEARNKHVSLFVACDGVATSACASFVWAWWFDRWNFKMADSSNVTVNDLKFKLRTGSSTDSAINQCARRVRIQNLGSSILLLHQTVSCLRVTMIRKHCWFNHSKLHCCFRDHNLSHKLRREKASVAPGSLSVTHHCE